MILVARVIYFLGVQATSLTTLAYTMLAFPVISLIAELVLGRVKPASLGVHDLVGFALLVAGYVVTVSKPLPQ